MTSFGEYMFIYLGIPAILAFLVGFYQEGDVGQKVSTGVLVFFGSAIVIMLLAAISLITNSLKQKSNQKIIPKKNKLPIYYSSHLFNIVITLALLYSVCNIEIPYYTPDKNLILAIIQTLIPAFLAIIVFIIFIQLNSRTGSVLVAERIIREKYDVKNVVDTKQSPVDLKNTSVERSLISLFAQIYIDTYNSKTEGLHTDYIQFRRGDSDVTIGSLNLLFHIKKNYEHTGYFKLIKNYSFIELEQNITFKENIVISKNITAKEILNETTILPKYRNLGKIFYENSREYAEKLMSDNIQQLVAELKEHFHNISILFSGNTITVSIARARWSTWFSKTFTPNKNAKNILTTTEIVLDYLTKISEEIEKEENY